MIQGIIQQFQIAKVYNCDHIFAFRRCFWNRQPHVTYMFYAECLVSWLWPSWTLTHMKTIHTWHQHQWSSMIGLLPLWSSYRTHANLSKQVSIHLVLLQCHPSHLRFSHMLKHAMCSMNGLLRMQLLLVVTPSGCLHQLHTQHFAGVSWLKNPSDSICVILQAML